MKKIAVIGGGYTGLSIAKRIIEKGNGNFEVGIYEKDAEVGGLVKAINKCDNYLDIHYRHIFKSDSYCIDMAKQFGINLIWPKTKMGYFTNHKLFEFGTPFSLLKFKPLGLINKIRFGLAIIDLKLQKRFDKLENYTAEEYIINRYGKEVYKSVWEPLLLGKFGNKKDQISMAWLWGKIALRSSSIGIDGERLGYIDGSYKMLTDKLYEYLTNNNCKFYLKTQVEKISNRNNKYIINDEDNIEYDIIVSTLPDVVTGKIYSECISDIEKKTLNNMEYTSAKTLILISKKSLSKYYWLNIGDKNIPFGGIIEHTNMISKDKYNNKNIIYISNYMYKNNKLYNYNAEELLEEYLPYLNKINPGFSKKNIEEIVLSDVEYAQPIIKTNYSKEKVKSKFEYTDLYIANMEQIYPEDRGMNYAIRLGYNIADEIISNTNITNQKKEENKR